MLRFCCLTFLEWVIRMRQFFPVPVLACTIKLPSEDRIFGMAALCTGVALNLIVLIATSFCR